MTDPAKNKKRFHLPEPGSLLIIIVFLFSSTCYGQGIATNITHHMFLGEAINPAFSGANDAICVTGLFRQQWMALKGAEGENIAPQTFYVTVDGPVKILHGGLGAILIQDKIANFTNSTLKVNYAYITDLGSGIFSAGAQLDLVNIKLDKEFKHIIQSDDDVLRDGAKSDFTVDGGIGFLYRVPDKYYVGLSVDQILESKGSKMYFTLDRTINVQGGYNWPFPGKPIFEVQPSVLLRTDLAVFTADISALLVYNKKFWGGLSYRYQDMAALLLGLNIKGIKAGISYDFALSDISRYQSGSIEVMLNYCFKIKTEKFRKSYRNTRFL